MRRGKERNSWQNSIYAKCFNIAVIVWFQGFKHNFKIGHIVNNFELVNFLLFSYLRGKAPKE